MPRLFPVKKLRPRSRFDSYSTSVEYATNQRLGASAGRIGFVCLAVSSGMTAIYNVMDNVPETVIKPLDVAIFAAEVALTQFCHRWYQDAVVRSEETFGEYEIARRAELAAAQRREQQRLEAEQNQPQTVQAQPEPEEPPAPQPPDEPPAPPPSS